MAAEEKVQYDVRVEKTEPFELNKGGKINNVVKLCAFAQRVSIARFLVLLGSPIHGMHEAV